MFSMQRKSGMGTNVFDIAPISVHKNHNLPDAIVFGYGDPFPLALVQASW